MKKVNETKIGGKVRPFAFNLNQSINYCRLRDISITEMNADITAMAQGKGDGSELRDLIWSSLKEGARLKKKPFDESPEDVGLWIDELTTDGLKRFIDAMAETLVSAGGTQVKKKQPETSPQTN